jgi:hypothetical protein
LRSGFGDYSGHTGGIGLILYSSSHPGYASARILDELGLGGDHGNGLCGTRANERAGKHRILYRQVKNLAIFFVYIGQSQQRTSTSAARCSSVTSAADET